MEGNNPEELLNRGPWKPDEDHRLRRYIEEHGEGNWSAVPVAAGLNRCRKSCRLRWVNYLRPDIKRGNFTPEENRTIINLHNEWGNKWAKIASELPGRTDNEIKNVWNSRLKKIAMKLASRKNGGNDTKTEGTSYASSSITGSEQNTEKALADQEFQELEIKTAEEELFNTNDSFSKPIAEIMQNLPEWQGQDLPKDQEYDGEGNIQIPVGSDGVTNQEQYCPYDDGEFAIPVVPDVDYWELMMESLKPLQEQNGGVKAQGENAEAQNQTPLNEVKSAIDDDLQWYKNMPGSPGNPFGNLN